MSLLYFLYFLFLCLLTDRARKTSLLFWDSCQESQMEKIDRNSFQAKIWWQRQVRSAHAPIVDFAFSCKEKIKSITNIFFFNFLHSFLINFSPSFFFTYFSYLVTSLFTYLFIFIVFFYSFICPSFSLVFPSFLSSFIFFIPFFFPVNFSASF